MSQRGQSLAEFRMQMTPDGPPVPRPLFWFVMGVAIGSAAQSIWEPGTEWWRIVGFGLAVGGIFGLLLNIPVWFAWTVAIHPITDTINTRRGFRRLRDIGMPTMGTVIRTNTNVSGTTTVEAAWETISAGKSTVRFISSTAFGFPPEIPADGEEVPLMYLMSDPHNTVTPISREELDYETYKLRSEATIK